MIIKNALVYTIEQGFVKKDIAIHKGLFEEISNDKISYEKIISDDVTCGEEEIIDGDGNYLIPGLVDIHFHGAAGHDFSDASLEGLQAIGAYELEHGITCVCPATMTLPEAALLTVCRNAHAYSRMEQKETLAELCGIHLEGPFISEAKKGAQNPAYIREADKNLFYKLQEEAHNLIKIISMAPEEAGAMNFIREISPLVHISLGHTNCDYDCAMQAFQAGADHVTHLFNAMTPFTHRNPGLIGAVFDDDNAFVELICDGIHVHPSAVRMVFRQLGRERIVLISDSLRATGMPDGDYMLGGLTVTVKGAYATLSDGTLAGSVSNLMDCVRKAVSMGITVEDAVYCATYTPAKSIGIDDKYGSIEQGKIGDCVLLNRTDLSVMKVIKQGKIPCI